MRSLLSPKDFSPRRVIGFIMKQALLDVESLSKCSESTRSSLSYFCCPRRSNKVSKAEKNAKDSISLANALLQHKGPLSEQNRKVLRDVVKHICRNPKQFRDQINGQDQTFIKQLATRLRESLLPYDPPVAEGFESQSVEYQGFDSSPKISLSAREAAQTRKALYALEMLHAASQATSQQHFSATSSTEQGALVAAEFANDSLLAVSEDMKAANVLYSVLEKADPLLLGIQPARQVNKHDLEVLTTVLKRVVEGRDHSIDKDTCLYLVQWVELSLTGQVEVDTQCKDFHQFRQAARDVLDLVQSTVSEGDITVRSENMPRVDAAKRLLDEYGIRQDIAHRHPDWSSKKVTKQAKKEMSLLAHASQVKVDTDSLPDIQDEMLRWKSPTLSPEQSRAIESRILAEYTSTYCHVCPRSIEGLQLVAAESKKDKASDGAIYRHKFLEVSQESWEDLVKANYVDASTGRLLVNPRIEPYQSHIDGMEPGLSKRLFNKGQFYLKECHDRGVFDIKKETLLQDALSQSDAGRAFEQRHAFLEGRIEAFKSKQLEDMSWVYLHVMHHTMTSYSLYTPAIEPGQEGVFLLTPITKANIESSGILETHPEMKHCMKQFECFSRHVHRQQALRQGHTETAWDDYDKQVKDAASRVATLTESIAYLKDKSQLGGKIALQVLYRLAHDDHKGAKTYFEGMMALYSGRKGRFVREFIIDQLATYGTFDQSNTFTFNDSYHKTLLAKSSAMQQKGGRTYYVLDRSMLKGVSKAFRQHIRESDC